MRFRPLTPARAQVSEAFSRRTPVTRGTLVLVPPRAPWVPHTHQCVSFPLLGITLLSGISLGSLLEEGYSDETIQHKALGQAGLVGPSPPT